MKRFSIWMITILLLLGLTACGQKVETAQIYAMDTVMDLTACGRDAEEALSRTEQQIYQLEALLSRTRETSEISAVNRSAGSAVEVEKAVSGLILTAQMYAEKTEGCFDITIAPVVSAWGFTADHYQVPEQKTLDALLTLVDSSRIRVEESSVQLAAGQSADLGGIAKGYVSDCAESIFRAEGLESGLVSLGGNVFALGTKPDGSAWRIGVKDPQRAEGFVGILSLQNAYAVTSGGYQRYFEEDGTVYHHIIDPHTGYPAQSGLLSVTVVAAANGAVAETLPEPGNGTMCDALSTALFVMGEEQALEFRRESGLDFELVLVTEGGRVVVTEGLSDAFAPDEGGNYVYETVS